MDPFTQKILDRAAQRSRQLGISDTSKFPNTARPEAENISATPSAAPRDQKNVVRFSSKKPLAEDNNQQYDNISVEINITTDTNVGVKCDVISMDVDEEGNVLKKQELINGEGKAIRDVSRNRLQRLGALYSDTENLSSPIHRTEARFCAETSNSSSGTAGVVPLGDRETPRPKAKTGKLAALADSINKWECDVSTENKKPTATTTTTTKSTSVLRTPTKSKTPDKARTPTVVEAHSKGAIKKTTITTPSPAKPKSLKWDKSVMDALESQGFQKRQSQGGRVTLTYDKDPAHDSSSDREKENRLNETMSSKKMALASNRDTGAKNSPKKLNLATTPKLNRKDPAELSLRDRLAIFERNKGTAVLPKAPLALPIPANKANPSNNLGRGGGVAGAVAHPPAPAPAAVKTPEKRQQPQMIPVNLPKAKSDAQGHGIQSTISALMQGGATISGQTISAGVKKEREREMDVLLNRFNKREEEEEETETEENESEVEYKIPAPPPPPPSHKRRSGDKGEEAKRHKTSQPTNRLYPQLSDVDDTSSSEQNYTTASVSEDNNQAAAVVDEEEFDFSDDSSYGDVHQLTKASVARQVLDSINKSNRERNITVHHHQAAAAEEEAQASTDDDSEDDGMDDYLDEALENNNDTSTDSRTDRHRRSVSSNSFSYSRSREKRRSSSMHQPAATTTTMTKQNPVESKMTLHEDGDEVKLIHTVSFYRRQQTATANSCSSSSASPKKRTNAAGYGVTNANDYCDESDPDSCMESDSLTDDPAATQRKIKQLLDEVVKQQQVIGQTSQALNLCASTVEFSGSTESVEGERHLLVATHRRQAALNEIQRLRVEGGVGGGGRALPKGQITITNVTLPLRQDYIRKLAADTISGHHLVCLVKYGKDVLATRTVPTLPGLLTVKFPDAIALPEVDTDFKITLEIYGMTAQREALPHDLKYHIGGVTPGKKATKMQLLTTPKGKRQQGLAAAANRLVMPPMQSPGGPSAVRTPGLVHYGFVIFSMREVRRTNWTLNTVSSTSPLDGTVHMKIDCQVEVSHNGFLTMFEEVSGFGAWHRRWCRLEGPLLSFWLYPDHVGKKTPIGTLDLTHSLGEVQVAPREICSRPNTLMLLLKQEDTQSRHLLSADSKEEREAWKTKFNSLNSWSSSSSK